MEQGGAKVEDVGQRGKQFRIAVFGDFMIDRYWIGETSRISPEAPIPVVKIEKMFNSYGGAGNVAENLKALGCKVEKYEPFRRPLPVKNRLMVGDHQIARWDENDECFKYQDEIFINGYDAVVVADYGKGAIDDDMIFKIKLINAPIFVDTKRDPSVWSGVATAIFPNEKEANQFSKEYYDFRGDVILKRGEKGLELHNYLYGNIVESHSQARFVRSVNGAGDTVLAAFVYKYLELKNTYIYHREGFDCRYDYKEMLNFANSAAACAVEAPYTSAPTLEEVEKRYNDYCNQKVG